MYHQIIASNEARVNATMNCTGNTKQTTILPRLSTLAVGKYKWKKQIMQPHHFMRLGNTNDATTAFHAIRREASPYLRRTAPRKPRARYQFHAMKTLNHVDVDPISQSLMTSGSGWIIVVSTQTLYIYGSVSTIAQLLSSTHSILIVFGATMFKLCFFLI